MWLFEGINNIDFSFKDFMKESFLVARMSNGGITFQDLQRMDFQDYLDTIKFADSLQEKDNG